MKFSFDVKGILAPLNETKPRFYVTVFGLLAIMAFGAWAYFTQLRDGLAVTGMNRPIYWGMYIGNFVFFVSVSLAGTLISAILRVIHAEWRRPITRCAEVITVLSLLMAVTNIMTDMGRPDRLFFVMQYGRAQSPILWDVLSINTYLAASSLYLYLPLIPDLAIIRDRNEGRFKWLYRILALGYTGTPKQVHWLERIIGIMAILIIPIGVSVHTVTAWLFATTVQPVWHSTIYGPFFVVGALYTGTAALVIIMALLRKVLGLKEILRDVHFNNIGLVLLAEGLLVTYFLLCMYMVEITGQEPIILRVVMSELTGPFAVPFWAMIIVGILFPPFLLSFKKGRSITGVVIASIIVVIAMWIERFLIVVPTLAQSRLDWPVGVYHPTWVEWSITGACVAAFTLGYILFTKVFPIVSLWEVQEGIDRALPEVKERYEKLLPQGGKEPAEAV